MEVFIDTGKREMFLSISVAKRESENLRINCFGDT